MSLELFLRAFKFQIAFTSLVLSSVLSSSSSLFLLASLWFGVCICISHLWILCCSEKHRASGVGMESPSKCVLQGYYIKILF